MTLPDGGRPAATEPPALVSLAQRIESVHRALGALSVTLDAVAASADSLRADVVDELGRSSDALAAVVRDESIAVAERHGATERAVVGLHDAVARAEASVDRLSGRVEDVATSVAHGLDESRGFGAALENLLRLVAGGFSELEASLGERGQAIADEVSAATDVLRRAADPTVILDSIAVLHDDLAEQVGAVRSELGQLAATVGARASGGLGAEEVDAIAEAVVRRVLSELEVVEEPPAG
jgi:hypothetical protein